MTRKLRQILVNGLSQQGFAISGNQLVPPDTSSKDNIRLVYIHLRNEKLREASSWLFSVEDKVLSYFANGTDVTVERIRPRIEVVDTQWKINLFRYASLLWSVPVSAGYGRRLRFLVFDESNGKLMGLFALGDPVYNRRLRDEWVGWGVKQKNERLYHVMDAYVLGSVPPYCYLLGGKLVAMLTTSDEVRKAFKDKYAGRTSVIRKVKRKPYLALITTTSALGRSSIYNRLSMDGRRLFLSLGFTQGWGHFHFSDGTFEQIKSHLQKAGDPVLQKYKYGGGPNWRFRVVKKALIQLGLPTTLLHHGIKREVFVAPLAKNTKEFLRGEKARPSYYSISQDTLSEYFKERWMLPRAERDQRYRDFNKESIRLTHQSVEEPKLC
jgi:hypothetical protein